MKITLANLKIEKLRFAFATSNFWDFFSNKFDSMSSWLDRKSFFGTNLLRKKREGAFLPPPPCIIGLLPIGRLLFLFLFLQKSLFSYIKCFCFTRFYNHFDGCEIVVVGRLKQLQNGVASNVTGWMFFGS